MTNSSNGVVTDPSLYIEHACVLETAGWRIPAALTLPASHATHSPAPPLPSAILLVPGSLYSDVNGDYPTWNSFPHVYAHLAHQLSARGHAVYRFAKLGPGTGSVAVEEELASRVRTWDGRLAIAIAALDAMRAALATRGIAAARSIGAGHSEGAVVISRVATSDRASQLDGVVLLAGPSIGILEIMREQLRSSTPPEQREEAMRRLDEAIRRVRLGQAVPPELSDGGIGAAAALASMPDEARRYMRECDATDPTALAARMEQPALVVQGGSDTSVPTHHGESLRDVLLARPSGESRTNYLFVPEVQHMFKVVPPDVTGPEAFSYPGEPDARVADGIDRWVRGLPPTAS